MGGLKESLILSLNDFPNGKPPLTHWLKSIHVEAQQHSINLASTELQWGEKRGEVSHAHPTINWWKEPLLLLTESDLQLRRQAVITASNFRTENVTWIW